jgi:CRISPR-associated protein Cas2
MSIPERFHYVICYDISDNRRRTRMAKVLEGYGERLQESVFEAALSAKKAEQLVAELRRHLKPEEDRLTIFCLCAGCARRRNALGLDADYPPVSAQPRVIVI